MPGAVKVTFAVAPVLLIAEVERARAGPDSWTSCCGITSLLVTVIESPTASAAEWFAP